MALGGNFLAVLSQEFFCSKMSVQLVIELAIPSRLVCFFFSCFYTRTQLSAL